jgi:murein DD-endopeptidase MepM/ murein hydrolase activator NlpD
MYGGYQRGAVDIQRPSHAARGENVYAIQDGVVTWRNPGIPGSSELKNASSITIKHTVPLILKDGTKIDEWYSLYGHMTDLIATGTKVKKGETVIGKISNVGVPDTSDHLHFVIAKNMSGGVANAISPYWLPDAYSSSKNLYADDLRQTRAVGRCEDPALYDKTIFLPPASYPATVDNYLLSNCKR